MKLLFVTWYFPPSNTIAAVRLGKLAKYIIAHGHDVRVLTIKNSPYRESLPVEVSQERIYRTTWWDINALPGRVMAVVRKLGLRRKPAKPNPACSDPAATTQAPPTQANESGGRLSRLYQCIFNFPDERIGWMPEGRKRGLELLKTWRPDGIFASGPPFTCLLVGYLLSRASGIPLIVEFRDRWSDDPYYPPPRWRGYLDRWLEEKIVRHSTAITTVSEPWAETYRERFAKPAAVIYNAFDPDDLPLETSEGWPDRNVLQILYTGGIYPGRRDPTPLFEAIGSDPDLKQRVRVDFYGTDPKTVQPLASACGVQDVVTVYESVNHAEATRLQHCSDLLLLMQWDDPKEQGNVPGKFFEYLGARRPIIVLGLADGVPATIVKERGAGITSTNPEALADALKSWLKEKQEKGLLPNLPLESQKGFTHEEQARELERFIADRLS